MNHWGVTLGAGTPRGFISLLHAGLAMDANELVQFLVQNGREWVQQQRDDYRPRARPLTANEKAILRPFFGQGILDLARIAMVPAIRNPEFYTRLEAWGIAIPIDFTVMEGITFVDTIFISQGQHRYDPPRLNLVFHELVHVVQYSLLGINDFVELYVRGWVSTGRDYLAIPLERHAYELQAHFERQPSQAFSVEKSVRTRLSLES